MIEGLGIKALQIGFGISGAAMLVYLFLWWFVAKLKDTYLKLQRNPWDDIKNSLKK